MRGTTANIDPAAGAEQPAGGGQHLADLEGRVAAINRSQAVIELALDGTVTAVNPNFCALFGYSPEELLGQHHRVLVEASYARSPEYHEFWAQLGRGQFMAGEFKRLARDGREIWLHATYNPILDPSGHPVRIVKYASDITTEKARQAAFEGRADAIARAQAVIEFDLDGYVLAANDNFLRMMGYSMREIDGQHHAIFCDGGYLRSADYRDFWLRLRRGEFVSGRFRRLGKCGREIWIQASYSPILDLNGRPVSVVKFAHDVTAEVLLQAAIQEKAGRIADTVERLTRAAVVIAERSHEARDQLDTITFDRDTGFDAVLGTLDALELLRRSSNEIDQIVQVIGDVAAQTNLLASNALAATAPGRRPPLGR